MNDLLRQLLEIRVALEKVKSSADGVNRNEHRHRQTRL